MAKVLAIELHGSCEEGYSIDGMIGSESLRRIQEVLDGLEHNKRPDWENEIKYIRNHYTKHNRVPELRELLRLFETNYGKEKSSRKYIYKLFPYGYGQQACKIAGMRQPKKLWLDV